MPEIATDEHDPQLDIPVLFAMDSFVEVAGVVITGITSVAGTWKLGEWWLRVRQVKLDAAQKENESRRLALREDRQGDEGRNTELIQRMQSMIDDLKAEIAALKKESAANIKACEDREERLQERVAGLEIYKARSSEYIRMMTSVYKTKIKGVNLPDFSEDPTPSSLLHTVLP